MVNKIDCGLTIKLQVCTVHCIVITETVIDRKEAMVYSMFGKCATHFSKKTTYMYIYSDYFWDSMWSI